MILVAPHDSDWDGIAALTGDPSWRAANMRRYLAAARELPLSRRSGAGSAGTGSIATGHGWAGWLRQRIRAAAGRDARRRAAAAGARLGAGRDAVARPTRCAACDADLRRGRSERPPLRPRRVRGRLRYTPLSTTAHQRVGARERVLDVAARYPDRLRIELHALRDPHRVRRATPGDRRRVSGRARISTAPTRQPRRRGRRDAAAITARARGHPRRRRLQLAATADAVRHRPGRGAAAPRHPGPGGSAGRRPQPAGPLRDRRGQPVGAALGRRSTAPASTRDDPLYREWRERRAGMYVSNGAAIALIAASAAGKPVPDLFMHGAARAVLRAISRAIRARSSRQHDYLTWAILKAHTANRAGSVSAALGRSARHPRGKFPLFRGRRRYGRRRSAGGCRRHPLGAPTSIGGADRRRGPDRRGGMPGAACADR